MVCAVFHRTIRPVPFCTVQRFLARTSRHPMDVRPHPLTPYVLTPFERTSTELMPYVQRIFNRRIWRFVPFGCHFFTLWESCIIGCGQPRLVLSHSQGVSECQNESKICKSVTKKTGGKVYCPCLENHRTSSSDTCGRLCVWCYMSLTMLCHSKYPPLNR